MIKYIDQQAAIAPIQINSMPSPIPHSFKTKGRDKTPDPIADAQRAKILPLRLPLSSFEKVLFQKLRLSLTGESTMRLGLMLISPLGSVMSEVWLTRPGDVLDGKLDASFILFDRLIFMSETLNLERSYHRFLEFS